MGNRILRDSILTSRPIAGLNWFERVMYLNLIVTVDDYGVYFADPLLLSCALFPRDAGVTAKMIRDGLKHLEEQRLILRYTAEGEEYLKLVSWEKEQRVRNSRRRFPAPEEADPESAEAEVPEEEEALPAGAPGEPEVRELPVEELPLNDRTTYAVTRQELEEYAALYPAVDVRQELRNMRGWCLSNPQKRKTRTGVRKFINSWLARVQNQGGTKGSLPPNPFLEMEREDAEKEKGGPAA